MKWNNPERWFLTRNIDFESQIKHFLTTILKDKEKKIPQLILAKIYFLVLKTPPLRSRYKC